MIRYCQIHVQIFPELRIGQDRRADQITLQVSKCFHSSHWNPFHFFNSWKNGLHLSTVLETKLFKAAIIPVSFCTSLGLLGGLIYYIALIWFGFTSMPRFVIIYPKNFLAPTPNAHLLVLRHSLCCLRISKASIRSITCLSSFLLLTTMSPI